MRLLGEKREKLEENEEYKNEKKRANIFEFVNAINFSKENLFKTKGYTEEEYNKFIIDKAFSQYPDTVEYANFANSFYFKNVPNYCHFLFYLNIIPERKRFAKWGKELTNENVELIMQWYDVSRDKALQVLDLFTEEDFAEMKNCFNHGGIVK